MANACAHLMRIINHYLLHYRYPKWKQILEVIKYGYYDDSFCAILIHDAEQDAEIIEKQGNFLPEPPTEEQLYDRGPPDIELGTAIESDCRMGINYLSRPYNVWINGSAGNGKTVLCRKILQSIDAQNLKHPDNPTSLWILDLKADNPDLPRLLKGQILQTSLSDNLRTGLNGPPNIPPYIWIAKRSISLAIRLNLVQARTCLVGVITMLLGILNQGLSKLDLVDPKVISQLTWPPLAMVLDAIKIRKILNIYAGKEGYGQTLIVALTGLLQDAGKLFDCSNGLDLDKEVLAKNRHFYMAGANIPSRVLHIVNDYNIDYVMGSRLFNNYKCDHTDIVFAYDEADLLLESDFDAAFSDGLTPLSRLNRLGRESGLMSLISGSAPQAASDHIRRNAYYTFCFGLSDTHSIQAAIHLLQLDPRCARMVSSLSPGECIFRQTQSSCNQAMWCKMDFVPPARQLGPLHYAKHPYTPAIKLSESPQVLTHIKGLLEQEQNNQRRMAAAVRSQFEQQALELLKLAINHLFTPVTRLMDKLGNPSSKAQIALRKYLEGQKYANFEEPRIGRTNMLLIEPTAKGYEVLGLAEPQGNKGRGSITHRHYAHWIKGHFETQGHSAFIEWKVPGTNHPVDVAVQCRDHWIILEIVVSATDNLLSHIQAVFAGSTDIKQLIIVAGTQKEIKALELGLMAEPLFMKHGSKIGFEFIKNFMGAI
ncbi:hypothetical protein ACFL6U_23365 [Planctomycetota bacterium]